MKKLRQENGGGWGNKVERITRTFGEGEPPYTLYSEIRPGFAYPLDALPPVMQSAVSDVCIIVQAPLELVATSALAAASALVQGIGNPVHPATGSVIPCSLFGAILADTGERKTSVEKELLAPIKEWEAKEWREYNKRQKDKKAKGKPKDHPEPQAGSEGGGGGARKNLDFEGGGDVEDLKPTIIVNDTTAEGLVTAMKDSIGIKFLATSEGGMFTEGYGMRAEGRRYYISTLCAGWDGADIRRNRVKEHEPPLFGKRMAMSILIQPKIGLDFLRDKGISEQGLTSRLLLCYPESKIGGRFLEAGFEVEVKEARARLSAGWNMTLKGLLDDIGDGAGHLFNALEFTPEAREYYREYYNAIEARMGRGQALAELKEMANKVGEQAVRISTVLVLFDNPAARVVGLEAIKAGVRLANYYLNEARRLGEVAVMDEQTKMALEVWGVVKSIVRDKERDPPLFYLKEIYENKDRSVWNAETTRGVMNVLVDNAYIIPINSKPEIEGSRRRDCWQVRQEALDKDPHP